VVGWKGYQEGDFCSGKDNKLCSIVYLMNNFGIKELLY
jgi:hypothetical protein